MCVELIRGMGPLEKEYGAKGVAFLLVGCHEEEAASRAFAAKEGRDHPFAFADAAAVEALGVRMAPTQVIVDREGRVAWTSSFGSLTGGVAALREALDGVLKRK